MARVMSSKPGKSDAPNEYKRKANECIEMLNLLRNEVVEVGCGNTQVTHNIGQKADWESDFRADLKINRRKNVYDELNCLALDWFCTARSKELPISRQLIKLMQIKSGLLGS